MSKINHEIYKQIKEKYGACSSWALWNFSEDANHSYDLNCKGYKLNTIVKTLNEDLRDEEINELGLHNDVVLVALNFGQRDESKSPIFQGINNLLKDLNFFNFHEELDIYKYSGDSRQKLAYRNTPLWGSYMTDLIKYNISGVLEPFADSNSNSDNLKTLTKDNDFMNIQVQGLVDELKLLGSNNPVIFALGTRVYELLNKNAVKETIKDQIGKESQIIKIDHYSRSNTISDEDYIKRVHRAIESIK